MDTHSRTRRQWLRSVAVTASALGLSACVRPQQAALALPTLVVDDPDFEPLIAELTRAWDPRKSGAFLQFGVRPSAGPAATADVVQILPGVYLRGREPIGMGSITLQPLHSALADANFNVGTLVPDITAPWTDLNGNVMALPIQIAELQFYVNQDRLKALSFQEPRGGAWTFADMRIALDRAVAADPNGEAPLVLGAWEAANFIGAVMLGFGGAVRNGEGRLDVTLATDAVRQFVDFTRHVRWPPVSLSQTAGQAHDDFLVHGFGGSAASALFAFAQPWSFLINASTKSALRAMTPAPFPAFPVRRIIPGFGAAGLAVNHASLHPDIAARFLLWLLQPDQQRLLTAHGWPPVILDAATGAAWQREMARNPTLPRFDLNAYFDFAWMLAPPPGKHSAGLGAVALLQGACVKMYEGEDVAAQLATVQKAIDAQGTG